MNRCVNSPVITALMFSSILISGCGLLARETGPEPLSGSGPVVAPQATPPKSEFPPSTGFLNDFAGVLSPSEAENLEVVLRELQHRGRVDFAVAVVKSTNGRDIVDYSLAMAREWKIGSENGGILLVVAAEDRKWRIQIDRKLERKFTNEEIKTIGDTMVPHFRERKYGDGLKACVKVLLHELAIRYDFDPIDL